MTETLALQVPKVVQVKRVQMEHLENQAPKAMMDYQAITHQYQWTPLANAFLARLDPKAQQDLQENQEKLDPKEPEERRLSRPRWQKWWTW